MVIRKKAIQSDALIEKFDKLLKKLDIKYNEISHYILAFIHRSVVNEKPDFTPEHNERLEFLGDAVLELVITTNLFNDYPKKTEGELTDIRSALVRGTNLSKTAKTLHFSEYLVLGKGEEMTGGRKNDYLLANVVEALIGAIYMDLGLQIATDFINTHIYPSVSEIIENNMTKDYKTTIQEYAQAEYEITPTYIVLNESGLDHDKTFEVGVYLGEKLIGKGTGSSKKKAQEKAAQDGFNNIKK
ncbi:MAG: ribonuclease III [Candidatus Gracilibacteria bacterium]|nr:ribonuclease III [Candidatus Gracilibacteria bacterium]